MSACANCGQESPAGARFCLACGAPVGGAAEPAETRKTVTVLFCDVVDSTPLGERLDPEAHRRVIGGYFDAVGGVIDRHGGTVEKFIGDAVMAVFGIPTVHEDDALRAVRAASEIREAVAPLDQELERDHGVRLRVRVGVATGEVVAGDPAAGQAFATGDTIVTAERLERAAQPSDVLIADSTYRLVADAVVAEPVEPVEAKGKAAPVVAWRLLGVQPGALGVARRFDTPLVGRERELATLRDAFAQAVAERRCRLVTVLGTAGIGKSRLVREFLLDVGPEANVLVGRCLPYGDGITFWPLRDILPDEPLEGTTDEIFWRVRKRFEQLGRERPLVLCFDDVHWAEPTFLTLIEYLNGWIADAPVLLLCLARPDLREHQPAWLTSDADTVVLALSALSDDDVATLVESLEAPPAARERIAEAAEGNPLFVEQMAAMAVEEGPSFVVPPSIRALIAARLDRLTAEERAAVERAAVFGREFPLRAVVELSPGDLRPRVAGDLLGLVRKELVRPAVIAFVDEDGFRFRHALIREVAYEGISKQLRAELHETCARWLYRNGGDDVIIGYHLEQAFRAREQIGRLDQHAATIAREAGELLGEGGQRAFRRGDVPAALSLIERALSLLPEGHALRPRLLVELGTTRLRAGDFAGAEGTLGEAIAAAHEAGDRVAELQTLIEQQFLRSFRAPEKASSENVRVAASVIPELEQLGDDLGLAKAWWLASESHVFACRWQARTEALERALVHARRVPEARHETGAIIALLAQALYYGPTPVSEAIVQCRSLREGSDDPALEAAVCATLGGLLAMEGQFPKAKELYAQSAALHEKLGLELRRAAHTLFGADIEVLAGDLPAAERELRLGDRILEAMGERAARALIAGTLADVVCAQGRDEEAEKLAVLASELADVADISSQVLQRATRARILARRGAIESAQALASEAVELAGDTDFPALQAAAAVALANVVAMAGEEGESQQLLQDAHALHRAKGNVVAARRLESLVSAFRTA